MKRLVIVLLALLVPILASGQTPAQIAAEKAIRETDAALAKAVAAKALDECVGFFDAEAALPSEAGTVYGTKDPKAVRGVWEQLLSSPGSDLKWSTDNLVVLKSGTLAYSSGTFDNSLGKGRFFAVWRKQPDGKWKLLVDAPWTMPAGKQ